MADILCPQCGKPNSEEQETCRHCQAPLKSQTPVTPASGAELPDWLRELQASEPAGLAEPFTGEDAEPVEADLPDWLRQILPAGETPAPAEQPAGPTAPAETPDWLDNLLATPEKPASPDESIPDWLAGFSTVEQPEPPSHEDELAPAAQVPARAAQEPEEADLAGAFSEQPVAPAEEGELPAWLVSLQEAASEKPAASVPAFTFDEEQPAEAAPADADRLLSTLPDWVSQLSAEQPEEPAAEPEPGLAPAELPGWLEAMRPTESAPPTAPLEDLSTAETVASGPLIGLRGVLSAEPDAIRARKPATHALKLRITDDQRARLALLEELLAGEQKARPLPAQIALTPHYLFRLAIALALLLPILWVVINKSNIAPLPAGEDHPTVMRFDTTIRALNTDDPVLVAVDYDAGFIGEMDLAANVLLSRVVEQGAFLALVSTNTAGPTLGQRLLTNLNETLADPYPGAINLGYLPGGTMGLASLKQSARQFLPYTLDDLDPWLTTPLSTVNTLADFKMVIVVTHDADTARAWIEQTGETLRASNVPLLLVVSAQAEPLVRPYADGQTALVTALLAGVPDSAAYENITSRYSPGRHEVWDALSLALPIAALVIVSGSLTGAVIAAIKEGQAEARNKPQSRRKTPPRQERP